MAKNKKLFLTVAAFCLSFSATIACAAPSHFGDVGHYRPGDPDTFRVLSGIGVPTFPNMKTSDFEATEKREKGDLLLLLPDLSYSDFYSIQYNGCRTASPLQQLRQRIQRLGAGHPYIQQWLAAERVVMSICNLQSKSKTLPSDVLPEPLATMDKSVARLQLQDRAYQKAAILFYQRRVPETLAAFQAIVADKTSLDRPQAAFMVVAVQAGSGTGKPMVSNAQTIKQIRAILSDPSLKDVHAIAAGLYGWLAYNNGNQVTRNAQMREIIFALMMPAARLEKNPQAFERYASAKQDIQFLQSQFDDPNWVLSGAVPSEYHASAALAQLAKTSPLAAWIAFPGDPYRSANWAVAEQWPRPAIVTAYIGKMGGDSGDFANAWVHINPAVSATVLAPMVDEEIQHLKVGENPQAAAALSFDFYNLERYLLMSREDGNFAEAVKRLKDFPAPEIELWNDTVHDGLVYLVAAGRMEEARKLRDALNLDAPVLKGRYTRITGALMVLAEDEAHLARGLNMQRNYPRTYLNALTVEELWRLADNSALNRNDRALFARAAWTREYAQSRVIDWRHDQLMRLLNPEVAVGWRSQVGKDVAPDDMLVLGDVLKSPAMNMVISDFSRMPGTKRDEYSDGAASSGLTGMDYENHNDNNWWCGWGPERYVQDIDEVLASDFSDRAARMATRYDYTPLRKLLAPALRQSVLFRNMSSKETLGLAEVACAPRFLASRTIEWVENTGAMSSRDGQAEALADVVVATRWGGNRQGKHGEYSRHAYQLLHKLFPNTPAAKRTRYWFD